MAFTQNDEETCKLIESILGNKTISIKNKSRKINIGLLSSDGSESTQYISRPLMRAQEIRLLPEDKALVIVQGHPPVYAKKIKWFDDEKFKHKMLGPITLASILPSLSELQYKTNEYISPKTDLLTPDQRDKNLSAQAEELDQII